MRKELFILLVVIMIINSPVSAKTAQDIGIAGIGARPMAMGKAFVAVADDANALFFNPAGISQARQFQATSMSTNYNQMVDYRLAGGVLPTAYGNIGLGYVSLSSTAGYATTDKASLSSASAINYGSSQAIISYSNTINTDTAAGVNIKMISNNFSGASSGIGSGYALDLGALFKINRDLNLGVSLQNIVSSLDWRQSVETLPSLVKLGFAGRTWEDKILLAADLDASLSNKPLSLHGGLEVKPFPLVAVRLGLDQDVESANNVASKITAGVGFCYDGFSFDYAYREDPNLRENSEHYFSLSLATDFLTSKKEQALTISPKKVTLSKVEEQKAMGVVNPILRYYQTDEQANLATQPVKSTVTENKTVNSTSIVKAAVEGDILTYYR